MVELMRAPGLNRHFVINDIELWGGVLDDYLLQFE
jgi:hypothetical protein